MAVFAAGLFVLGCWQIERRAWKLELIGRVEQRVHASPVGAPIPNRWVEPATARWPALERKSVEYLHVTLTGRFLPQRDTFVQAVTALGGGFWVMTPLAVEQGFIVLVNRGFISGERADMSAGLDVQSGPVTITGLLRMSEPRGAFLRTNAPADDRWYSRDVMAIAKARKLANVAPYFIDADAGMCGCDARVAQDAPIGGLTVVKFRNDHLLYAITWFSLSLMAGALSLRMFRTG